MSRIRKHILPFQLSRRPSSSLMAQALYIASEKSEATIGMAWKAARPLDSRSAKNLQREIISVATLDAAGDLHVAGCACIVSVPGDGRQALCLTAAHVFRGIFDLQARARRPRYVLPGAEDDKLFDLCPWLIDRKVRAVCILGNSGYLCDITSLCVLPPLDIGLMLVEVPKGSNRRFENVVALNSDPLLIGAEVILASFRSQTVSRVDQDTYDVKRDLAVRIGRVVSIEITGSGLIRAPVYFMSMPADAGMSGAPVFLYDSTMRGPKQVCGIISSDMSPPEAFTDPEVDGQLITSVLWPAAPLNIPTSDGTRLTLKAMVERDLAMDFGTALRRARLETFEDGKWSVTLPQQQREVP